MGEPVIEAREIVKDIKGRRIIDGVSLNVAAGEVVGFIGPNGAGKTTLIRILSGMSHLTAGEARVCGRPVGTKGVGPQDLAVLPESPGFVEHLSGARNLEMLASLGGRITKDEVAEAIAACGLDPLDRRPVDKYSLGMRQRLALAQALMERPRVLILDEPTNGLDVVGIAELRKIIRNQAQDGVGVFLASHLLSEVEFACDRVLMVVDGRVLQELTTTDLRSAAQGVRVTVSHEEDWTAISTAFAAKRYESVKEITGVVRTDIPVPELIRTLVAMGVDVEEIGPHQTTLEEAFLATVATSL